MVKIKNIRDVSQWRLCVGCGACAYICPEKIKLVNVVNQGIRPILIDERCESCTDCLSVCPGYDASHNHPKGLQNILIESLKKKFGPIIEVWEGYAANPDMRYCGSSGGLASAIAQYCLNEKKMHGVLHIAQSGIEPWKNETVLSTNFSDLLMRTGSRYSPASPCDGLSKIESAPSPCVFIGKPCDVIGLRKAQKLRPALNKNVGLSIGIFCAGTPSTMGTMEILKHYKINKDKVIDIRYRGKGWPGKFSVHLKEEETPNYHEFSYKESWGFLNRYRPFRCYLCPDGTSEFADISCGDPWYRELKANELGYSIVLIRTARGKEIVDGAMKAGYVILERADPKILLDSQKNLLLKRSAIWGRLLALKLFILPAPYLSGFSLYSNWCNLPIIDKLRSIFGTVRRIISRKYYRPDNRLSGF